MKERIFKSYLKKSKRNVFFISRGVFDNIWNSIMYSLSSVRKSTLIKKSVHYKAAFLRIKKCIKTKIKNEVFHSVNLLKVKFNFLVSI